MQGIKTHILKLDDKYWCSKVVVNHKRFEVRKNDRDFQVGDKVIYKNTRTGKLSYEFYIIYMTDFMQKDGYIVFGDEPVKK